MKGAAVLLVGALLAGPAALAAGPEPDRADPVAAGRRIFFGDTPVEGAITGHAQALPGAAAVCANCHTGIRPQASARPFGAMPLGRAELTDARRRRGGPVSAFSQASFCRLLRTGVDPAFVLISRRMPRYAVTDDQCASLWAYLTEADGPPDE